MCSRAFFGLSLVIAFGLCLPGTASLAQQAPATTSTSPPRLGYYTRVQSQASTASPASSTRKRSRGDMSRSLASRDAASSDPLRPYGNETTSGAATVSRPYERAPVVSPPERETPAPSVGHNYFPSTRAGQSANHNVVSHCVPGRHSFMHR